MTYDLVGLMNANVAEAVEVRAGDSLSTIVQKGCLRLGNYRCPHDPSSTTHDIRRMPEVWPLVFSAIKDNNALGNILSTIRSGFGAHQEHIIKQLALSAESLHPVLTFPGMAITGDITAEKEKLKVMLYRVYPLTRGRAPWSTIKTAYYLIDSVNPSAAEARSIYKKYTEFADLHRDAAGGYYKDDELLLLFIIDIMIQGIKASSRYNVYGAHREGSNAARSSDQGSISQ